MARHSTRLATRAIEQGTSGHVMACSERWCNVNRLAIDDFYDKPRRRRIADLLDADGRKMPDKHGCASVDDHLTPRPSISGLRPLTFCSHFISAGDARAIFAGELAPLNTVKLSWHLSNIKRPKTPVGRPYRIQCAEQPEFLRCWCASSLQCRLSC